MPISETHTLNGILAALPADDYRRISNRLFLKSLHARQILHRRDEPLREICFPSRSLCSLIVTMDDGRSAEIAVVGSEGLIGLEAALGLSTATCDATVHVAGDGVALAMNIDAFQRELDLRGALHSSVISYLQAFVEFVTQAEACNGLHSAEARCCRWLLNAQDRVGTSDIPLTHDLIATMLGVRRPTVTLVIAELAQLGIISSGRGVIRITDRPALEARACECYRAAKTLFDPLRPHNLPDGAMTGRAKPWQ